MLGSRAPPPSPQIGLMDAKYNFSAPDGKKAQVDTDLLFDWVNAQLKESGCSRTIKNFSTDLSVRNGLPLAKVPTEAASPMLFAMIHGSVLTHCRGPGFCGVYLPASPLGTIGFSRYRSRDGSREESRIATGRGRETQLPCVCHAKNDIECTLDSLVQS